MPAPWAGGAQVRIIGRIHGQVTNNVLNFATNTQVNDPQTLNPLLVQLATAILECVAEHLLDAVTGDWACDGVEARLISPNSSDPVFVAAQAGANQGAKGATSVSFASAQCNVRTGTGGRSGRGRIFFPPPGEDDITNSALSDPGIGDFNSMLNCILGKFVGAGATEPWRLGVLSRKKVGDPPALPAFDNRFREAIALDMSRDMSVISSRRKGHGV